MDVQGHVVARHSRDQVALREAALSQPPAVLGSALTGREPKERTPALSDDSVDKMMACLNYNIGKWGTKNAYYVTAPSYLDACWEWYQLLSLDHREMVSLAIDVWVFPDRRPLAEMIAASLPPAPKCPAVLAHDDRRRRYLGRSPAGQASDDPRPRLRRASAR